MHKNIELPAKFIQQIKEIIPEHLSIAEFEAACKRPLRTSIRVNTLKITVDDFKTKMEAQQWQLEPVPWCDTGFWLTRPETDETPLGNTSEHLAGLFYIQEASSMMPVSALFSDPEHKFSTILDVASAPGSKTTQIAALMDNKGALVANEYSASRIKVLHANILRCGVKNTALTHFDGRVFGGWAPESFDAILLDAPCSGEGIVRKDPLAMRNWSLESVDEIAETQRELIISAFQSLKPGGTMVYSTCTLNLTENHQVLEYLQSTFGDAVTFEPLNTLFDGAEKAITEQGFLHIFPQIFDCEGFFVAKIQKNGSVETPKVKKRLRKFPFSPAKTREGREIADALRASLQIEIPVESEIWLRDSEVWLFPSALVPLLSEIKFDRIGVKLAETHKKGFKWQHEAVIALSNHRQEEMVELTTEQAIEWYMGRDVRPELVGKGEVIVSYQNYPIGLGKWVGNRVKNGYPRDLVRDKNLFKDNKPL
ncbi:16S rRNA (cytosine(1407)-C(5))-methyltransferase RsmF [Vibrio sp. SS-MA-C1-2]|uniref:16S rRNA (cytosine(1407)-C(5))-methyltransferase RsmF n=1 Tax=Vibrio sp. SS-MA-C1-2 TaxID=2908646 RepID=UPI001F1C73F3|nr:16S rRNA (cytosine(1407)-C(5))-methyltransferase RsmF [Vibrio sp. SS-MA-C1-2]UJF18081.1 16S rRNA (cytosine(1407)-C(5))-methyltransferase RsmF [Vibrio sp. SS-MA-C1-2]